MRIWFTSRALDDLEEAVAYYDGVPADLGERFRDQLDRVVERLQLFPHGAPPVQGFPDVRRARMRRFPYGLFYRVDDEDLVVLRVLHARSDIDERLADPD